MSKQISGASDVSRVLAGVRMTSRGRLGTLERFLNGGTRLRTSTSLSSNSATTANNRRAIAQHPKARPELKTTGDINSFTILCKNKNASTTYRFPEHGCDVAKTPTIRRDSFRLNEALNVMLAVYERNDYELGREEQVTIVSSTAAISI